MKIKIHYRVSYKKFNLADAGPVEGRCRATKCLPYRKNNNLTEKFTKLALLVYNLPDNLQTNGMCKKLIGQMLAA